MSQHTPGDWKTLRGVKKHREAIFIKSSTGEFVGKVYGHEGQPTEANAAILKAAPDLLAALKSVAETIVRSEHWWMDCPDKGGFDLAAINAAIAKAEGK